MIFGSKKKIITKPFNTLLKEVNNGDYHDFRLYLNQQQIKEIDLNLHTIQQQIKNHHINLKRLAKAFKNTPVRSLKLSGDPINNYDSKIVLSSDLIKLLTKGLKNTQLTALSLENCYITDPVVETLMQELINTPINTLSLANNGIIGNRAKELCEYLKATNITSLNLKDNYINPDNLTLLIQCLADNQKITALDLSHNYLNQYVNWEPSFAPDLKNTNIVALNLAYNNLTRYKIEQLVNELKGSKISTLDLRGNDIGSDYWSLGTLDRLARCVPETRLHEILTDLNYSPLQKALEKNKDKSKAIQTLHYLNYLLSHPEQTNWTTTKLLECSPKSKAFHETFNILEHVPTDVQKIILNLVPSATLSSDKEQKPALKKLASSR